jgi:hypothetical protein
MNHPLSRDDIERLLATAWDDISPGTILHMPTQRQLCT